MSTTGHSDVFLSETGAFMAWLQRLPGARINPKIQIADLRQDNAGRGIVATADIEEDEELFSISQSDLLTVQNSSLQQVKPILLERLDAWNALILCMIHEDGQGQDSKWWPYLQVLPNNFDTLIYWSPSELAELEGSAVLDKIGKDAADASFIKILLPIVQQNPDLFGRFSKEFDGPNAPNVLLELAHRMATLIMAYGFDLEAEDSSSDEEEEVDGSSQSAYELNKGMVPFADLFNADGHLNNSHLLQHESSMTMIALRKITSGQQIFNDFGQLPRSDLLRRYGYTTSNYKRWDVVEVDIETITEAASKYNKLESRAEAVIRKRLHGLPIKLFNMLSEFDFYARDEMLILESMQEKELRLELAASWGVLQDGYDLSRPLEITAFEFDQAMILTITALLLNPDDIEQAMEESPEQPPSSMLTTLDLVLREIVTSRQKAYKTTIAEDYGKSNDVTLQRRHKMAIEVRLGEKEILALAASEIDKRISSHTGEANHDVNADHAKRQKVD